MHRSCSTAGKWFALVVAVALGAPSGAAAATYTVTTVEDVDRCDATVCGLRGALGVARDGDTIRIPAGEYRLACELAVDADVALTGDGASRTVIRAGDGRAFTVSGDERATPATVVMSQLQVAGGLLAFGRGGNILNYGTLTLDRVRVTGGRAYQGGGVANVGGRLAIRHSLIDGNVAAYAESGADGGGIYSASFDDGGLDVRDSTIAFNRAQRGAGVAIEHYGQLPGVTAATLERVTIARNRAGNSAPGGLLIDRGARVSVTGSLLAANSVAIASARAAAGERPSNCDPLARPVDDGGNLADTDDCALQTPPADPALSADLVSGLGPTPVLTIPPHSPAVDLAGGTCAGTDQRGLTRPQGVACDAGAYEVSAPVIEAGPAGPTSDPAPSFAFASGEAGAAFECRLDGPAGAGSWEACTSPKRFAALPAGDYTFSVRSAGATAQSSRAFRVVAIAAPPMPPSPPPAAVTQTPTPTATPQPQYRRSVVVKPTSGKVKVRLPGTRRYVDLDAIDDLPLGSSVDVREGRVRLYAARDRGGTQQAASFYGGVFRVVQRGRVTELQLRGPKPVCASGNASASTHQAKKKKKARTRRLWGSGKGTFRTSGKYSAATVRGTKWLVQDSCRSTTTVVRSGVVTVRDFRTKRTIRLRAGDRYVARRR